MYVLGQLESETQAKIRGICESQDQAQRALDPEADPKIQVFEWSGHQVPAIGELVEISNNYAVPHKRPPLVALYEELFKRSEITKLRFENSALATHVFNLESKLQNEPAFYDKGSGRTPTGRQVRDLWLCPDINQAHQQIVDDYVHAEQPTLTGRIMLVPDAKTANLLNRQAQERRADADSFDPHHGMACSRTIFHSGDRVQFLRTDSELGVRDGDLGDVVKLFPDLDTIVIAIDSRKVDLSELVLVPLEEYSEIDLAYAASYERAKKMDLYQVFVLGDSRAATRKLVDSLPSYHVEIYADMATAYEQFPDYLQEHESAQNIDQEADPLANYR